MKITDVKTFVVNALWRNWVFVKVYTDEGISGLGEATLEGKELTVVAAIKELKGYVIGKDPFNVEDIWQKMSYGGFWRGGPVINTAISGMEHALWDIIGKKLNVPVYKLLGGLCRDKIKVYVGSAFTLGATTPEECAQNCLEIVEQGFATLKGDPFGVADQVIERRLAKDAIERVRTVRKAVGDEVDICIEAHGRFNTYTAIKMGKELEEFSPFFYEEPVPPENVDAMVKVARAVNIPIASGERLYTKYGFRELLEKQAVSIIQPDICHAGGILECKKISAMAEVYYIPVAPHNPNGPVATAVNVQLMACIPNASMLELVSHVVPWRKEVLTEPIEIKGGYIKVPSKPGLGIELNEEVVAKYPYKEPVFGLFKEQDFSTLQPFWKT